MLCAYCASAQGFSRKAEKSTSWSAPVAADRVADRVLHERVRADDEVAGQPAPDEQRDGGEEVTAPAQPMLAEDEQAEEARLEEEREQSFHRERLADDAAGVSRERRPVGAELELHRHAGDDADGEVDAEDPDPESRGVVPARRRAQTASDFSTTMSSARPIVSCGKR